jgi:hypothetical protein
MIIRKMAISRRTFLRGAGVGIALPFLDAMVPAFSAMAATAAPRRLGYIYIPMCMNWNAWIPKEDGRLVELSPTLASLKPFADQITVVTNTELKDMAYPTGNHAAANAIFPAMSAEELKEATRACDDGRSDCSKTVSKETAIPRSSSAPI